MNGYSWISVISLVCYLFLFLTFMGAQKSERVIRSFMKLLVVMICWTGGSFGMRMMLPPSVAFWHHLSLLGMMVLPVAYMHFVLDFLEERKPHGRRFWFALCMVLYVFNILTNFFVPLPEVVRGKGTTQFLYHYNWHIYLLFTAISLCLFHMATIIRRHCLGDRIAFRRLVPVILGIVVLLLGHGASTFPAFMGLPLDIISGVINALFLFYALYKKRLFRMTMLLSKSNYSLLALIFGVGIFSSVAVNIQRFLIDKLEMQSTHATVVVFLILAMTIAIMYFLINAFFDTLFVRSEQQQSTLVARFGEDITHMLSVDEILQNFADTVQEAIPVDRLFVCIRDPDNQYRIAFTTNPLEEKNFYIRSDNPLVAHFKNNSSCTVLREFARTTLYRSMWEKEKQLFKQQDLDCFAPLMSDGDLIGLVLLAEKQEHVPYETSDLNFLQSISTICAMAVRNAHAYERALEEARRDELTGLINRKFFFDLLESEVDNQNNLSLSLCIFNIDDFKLYNQLYGTQEGNAALQRVAGILDSALNERGKAARIGGKEFALILPDYDIYSAKCLAENLAAQIGEINNNAASGAPTGKLTVSVGICAAPYMASTAKELFKNAETAVYAVKRSGKNSVLMYSAEVYQREVQHAKHKSGYTEHASTIYALTAAIDAKDHYTFQHSQNVAYYASELARACGMDEELVEIVKEAGLLHDIGKIGIREDILNKPGKLTSEEYDVMKTHPDNAVNIIKYLPSLDYVIPAVLSHHERYDGRGYPRRLVGENIPITGRILTVADAFDAMTSVRSYKNALSVGEALERLRQEAGTQFDPNLVQIFCELVENGTVKLQAHGSRPPEVVPQLNDNTFKTIEGAPEMQD